MTENCGLKHEGGGGEMRGRLEFTAQVDCQEIIPTHGRRRSDVLSYYSAVPSQAWPNWRSPYYTLQSDKEQHAAN
jgi:hypothetical protein